MFSTTGWWYAMQTAIVALESIRDSKSRAALKKDLTHAVEAAVVSTSSIVAVFVAL